MSGAVLAGESAELDALIERACAPIAPTWPLDRFIAVNPFWEMVEAPLPAVSARLAALSGARLLMPRSWFHGEWLAGRFEARDLEAAIAQAGASVTAHELEALMKEREPPRRRRARVMDVEDSRRDLTHRMSWRDFITHATSQFCASYFDDGQARLHQSREGGLYASWRRQALHDRGPSLAMGHDDYLRRVRELPLTAREMAEVALRDLGIPVQHRESYLTGLLLDLNGWAAFCAYLRWTARLAGRVDGDLRELLSIRLGWEWLLLRSGGQDLAMEWHAAISAWDEIDAEAKRSEGHDWLLQRAVEIAWQRQVCGGLANGAVRGAVHEPSAVQVACCIDVRSEVFRRALEAQSPRVQTLGFAGFFGMPIEYTPLAATSARPQLPGLLAPRLSVTDTGAGADVSMRRTARLAVDAAWKTLKGSALSSFAFVESMGLVYGGKLLADSFGWSGSESPERAGLSASEDATRRPRLTAHVDGAALTRDEECGLAEGMLRAMSLTRGFARLVVLLGHGSHSRNNPYAAGLDCGACCGQTGEVNARVAAALLNDPKVRAGLAERGIEVPPSTVFVAGLHDTTTDRVTLYETDLVPTSHAEDLKTVRGLFEGATEAARAERAPRLGLSGLSREAIASAIDQRSGDWAEVRPEWGLANNAAFIVARRERSRHLDLGGRAFLHDYRSEEDPESKILELIMTAPMVVAHWINLQYYASTVDNLRYGSGNKVLHNVVGGHLGVFEGNGGDLRIGLPLESLHDGERWVHTPLRLSVFIEAESAAIDAILRKHDKVRALVDNEWLYLFQLDAEARAVRAYRAGAWTSAE